ncbi:hypothetical protein, partial [Serratia marcescens]|uniref:hypothetical protein n=1 Tax=Serratia marcescens TaxID=615 RepID=UPI001E3442A9
LALEKLIGTAWRTYYFLRLLSQTIFPNSCAFAQFAPNMGDFTAKRAFYQQATAASVATKQETNRENNHEKEEGG